MENVWIPKWFHHHARLSGLTEPKSACPIHSNTCSSYFVIKTRLMEGKGWGRPTNCLRCGQEGMGEHWGLPQGWFFQDGERPGCSLLRRPGFLLHEHTPHWPSWDPGQNACRQMVNCGKGPWFPSYFLQLPQRLDSEDLSLLIRLS